MTAPADQPDQRARVTAANWQDPPFNRWAYWHVREILPTQPVRRADGAPSPLVRAAGAIDVREIESTRWDGSTATVGAVLDDSFTDAYAIMQDGELVQEWYGPLGARDRPHALMSVAKSVVGCVAAVLIEQGKLDPGREVTAYVPELLTSGYAGATVRDVLDMRSGVAFREEYTDPDSEVRRLDEWIGWRPTHPEDPPRGLYGFLTTLRADREHGGPFRYRSAETDVLGWVCERAAGIRMAELISTLIWQPMGAEFDAELLCDGVGTAVHDGGLCATARDLARFGQMLLAGGVVPAAAEPVPATGNSNPVVPAAWLRQAWAADADVRGAFVASPAELFLPGGWYRNQFWFRPGAQGDVLLCLGIHGQMLHVSRRTRTVCVKFSTWPRAQEPVLLQDTLRAFDTVGAALARQRPARVRKGLPGVVAGTSRTGRGDPSRGATVI